MSDTFQRFFVALVLLFVTVASLTAGGWSVITLVDFPAAAVAGQPVTLTFSVRQHGRQLVSGLTPTVLASTPGGPALHVRAKPTSNAGEYAATMALDRGGAWSIAIDGGFNPDDAARRYNSIALPPLRVVDAPRAPAAHLSEAERGAALLVTKGCISCHGLGSTKDVTQRRLSPDDVRALLADPGGRGIEMPDLGLRPSEISALAVYIGGLRDQPAPRAPGLTAAER